MDQHSTLNIKLSNSQLNKSKSPIKNGVEVTLNLSSNLIRNSNDETNFSHKLLLNATQVSKICKASADGSSANIRFYQLSKVIQSGGAVICDRPIFGNILSSVATKETAVTRNLGKDFLDKQINKFNKEHITRKCSEIILTNNEIKYIRK